VNISSSGALNGRVVSRVENSSYAIFAIVDEGKGIVAWGSNEQYQLGDGTTTNRTTPVDVTTNIMAVLDP